MKTDLMNVGRMIMQSNFLTQSRFELTTLEYNVFLCLLNEMKYKKFEGNTFVISTHDLMSINGSKKSHLVTAARNLVRRTYEKKYIEGGSKKYLVSSFVSSVVIDTNNIKIELSDAIMMEYRNLSQYTEFQLHIALKANSRFTKRIYTILSQYRNGNKQDENGIVKLYMNVADLKYMMELVDVHGDEKFEGWYNFEKKVLKVAQSELAKLESDITFNYSVASKKGKKIETICFDIIQTKTVDKQKEHYYSLLTSDTYKLAKWQARIVVENVDLDALKKALLTIHARIFDNNNPVVNKGAYTAKLLNNLFNLNIINDETKAD